MRYFPAAAALSLALAVTASHGIGAPRELDSRAANLLAQGAAKMQAGEVEAATDAFETALAFAPGDPRVYLRLAQAARQQGLQGKAIRYYRDALQRDPDNFAAISGEGSALVEKGAVEKARRNLTRLETLCGRECPETAALAQVIASGAPQQRVVTAEAITPEPVVTNN